MFSSTEKERWKEKSQTQLEEVLEELKTRLPIGSRDRDMILQLIGRANDLHQPEKLHQIVKTAMKGEKKEVKESEIMNQIISFYSREKNRIKLALFETINRLGS